MYKKLRKSKKKKKGGSFQEINNINYSVQNLFPELNNIRKKAMKSEFETQVYQKLRTEIGKRTDYNHLNYSENEDFEDSEATILTLQASQIFDILIANGLDPMKCLEKKKDPNGEELGPLGLIFETDLLNYLININNKNNNNKNNNKKNNKNYSYVKNLRLN